MIETFRFLSDKSDGTSTSHFMQMLCYNMLVALTNDGIRIETTITPFSYHYNNCYFYITSLTIYPQPQNGFIQYRAHIEVGRYSFNITYNKLST